MAAYNRAGLANEGDGVNDYRIPDWAVGFVYLLDTSDRYQKIGFSKHPARRAGEFTGLPFVVSLRHAFPVYTESVETTIQVALRPKQVRCEWFCLFEQDVRLFCSVEAVRQPSDLPPAYRPHTQRPGPRRRDSFVGPRPATSRGRKPGPWFRKERSEWCTYVGRRLVRLGVHDPNDIAGARAAFERITGLPLPV